MAEVSCSSISSRSFSKEETNMAADQALLKKSNSNIYGDTDSLRCDRCRSKKKRPSVVCIDCGDLVLCNECNQKVHKEIMQMHQFHELNISSKEKNKFSNGVVASSNQSNAAELDIIQTDVPKSLLLIDSSEKLKVKSEGDFKALLSCQDNPRVKVVSIFGNTGDGKSHTLNHTFFNGVEVFDTSPCQKSCTVGVWAAYDKTHKVIILDTEGLLGVSENTNQRMRLLLKILAISDIVIYRTRAERLHSDMFAFLGDASEAYLKYFTKDLQSVKQRGKMMETTPLCNLGPSIIIFQETHYTTPLGHENGSTLSNQSENTPEEILRENFANIGRNPAAFSSISYVGTRTQGNPTDFSILLKEVQLHVKNSAVRSPRPASVIFNALVHLNSKFGDEINGVIPNSFPDEYFTCTFKCQSCSARCESCMNHEEENKPHMSSLRCKYQAQFENRVYICKICYEKGVESMVFPKTAEAQDSHLIGLAKFAWSGYVLECPECGVIYRSRQYWYGNRDPVENSVRAEIKHCWPGTRLPHGNQNAARRLLDGVHSLASKITNVSAKPTQVVTNWVTDKVAPSYWTPNYLIFECIKCGKDFEEFEKKHHCRACGQGFCDTCTQHRIPVPDRGWGDTPVRVCDRCFIGSGLDDQANNLNDNIDVSELLEALNDDPELETGEMVAVKTAQNIPVRHPPDVVTTRKVTETVHSTLSYLTSTLEYPLEYLVDSARPEYWIPDSKIPDCFMCKREFKSSESKHHCRSCGQGFCGDCSTQRLPVPSRGWDYPVRVCDTCAQKKGPL
ncbi:zinc finger FYVE domain-containing protein 1-like [Hydractinia symbiolongicarpus]|uniref:zinc finger FYVE domain-containing protein 1-like n=1 Tax=Hydractinia symbiolongicarpus TaxID=13093 RepID=UPI00254FFC7B|nr:zinc finger FYVE domain-containing protein 1-like [Hydractinia symbiolongicarpus]